MLRSLLPFIVGLRMAEQPEPQVDGILSCDPAEHFLQLVSEASEQVGSCTCTFCQKLTTSTTTRQTARTAPITAVAGSVQVSDAVAGVFGQPQ